MMGVLVLDWSRSVSPSLSWAALSGEKMDLRRVDGVLGGECAPVEAGTGRLGRAVFGALGEGRGMDPESGIFDANRLAVVCAVVEPDEASASVTC